MCLTFSFSCGHITTCTSDCATGFNSIYKVGFSTTFNTGYIGLTSDYSTSCNLGFSAGGGSTADTGCTCLSTGCSPSSTGLSDCLFSVYIGDH